MACTRFVYQHTFGGTNAMVERWLDVGGAGVGADADAVVADLICFYHF